MFYKFYLNFNFFQLYDDILFYFTYYFIGQRFQQIFKSFFSPVIGHGEQFFFVERLDFLDN